MTTNHDAISIPDSLELAETVLDDVLRTLEDPSVSKLFRVTLTAAGKPSAREIDPEFLREGVHVAGSTVSLDRALSGEAADIFDDLSEIFEELRGVLEAPEV